MFKLVILLMIKSSAGHTMEVTVKGFTSIQNCEAVAYDVVEHYTGWKNEQKVITHPGSGNGRVLAAYCKRIEDE